MAHGGYDAGLMKRGEEARRLVRQGEDPVRMLLAVVWPDEDWAELALDTPLNDCPRCSGGTVACDECGSTGLVTVARRKLLAIAVNADTKVRRQGKKTLADLKPEDRVLVQARVCKADLKDDNATPPALTASKVIAHPAKAAKDEKDEKEKKDKDEKDD
jgi:hypothetical protein